MYKQNIILLSWKWEKHEEYPKFEYLGIILKSIKTEKNNSMNNTGNISQIFIFKNR